LPSDLDAQHVTDGPAFDALGLVHRVRVPAGTGPHPTLIMLHGLHGTEDVTWVFARAASPEWLIISPRAPFPSRDGYRWSNLNEQGETDRSSFEDGLAALDRFMRRLPEVYPVDSARIIFLGFSQGAATAYAYVLPQRSQQVKGIAALSGFIAPTVAEYMPRLDHLPVLILHGVKDETVPIDTARRNRDQLFAAGADVTYLESEVGHKVSSAGMAELRRWLSERLPSVH